MYQKPLYNDTGLNINKSVEGDTIEVKMERIMNNNEPTKEAGAQLIYTERSQGIGAAYNPRTDRFVVAVEAMDKVEKSLAAKRESKAKGKVIKLNTDSGAESTQGKAGQADTSGNQ